MTYPSPNVAVSHSSSISCQCGIHVHSVLASHKHCRSLQTYCQTATNYISYCSIPLIQVLGVVISLLILVPLIPPLLIIELIFFPSLPFQINACVIHIVSCGHPPLKVWVNPHFEAVHLQFLILHIGRGESKEFHKLRGKLQYARLPLFNLMNSSFLAFSRDT